MILDRKEYQEYLKVHLELLFFVAKRKEIISEGTVFKKFLNLDIEKKNKCREELYGNMELLNEYIEINFNSLTVDQIRILEGFKKKITGDFIVLKCLSKHAIFIHAEDSNFYAVKALSDRFDVFFEHYPALCRATIIPFKGKIIYDGFIQLKGIHLGPNTRKSLNAEYINAKKEKKIIDVIE